MNTAQKMLAEAQKLTARAMDELVEEKTASFSDEEDRSQAGMIAKIPSLRDDPYVIRDSRTLALVKAVEARVEGDDDHAILARAGRFLTFLLEGA